MKRFNKGLNTMLIAIVFSTMMISAGLSAQVGSNAIMLQQSPPDGGTITPGTGVHNFDTGSQVTLNAVPKPGYQFVYWIGDVSDTTSNSTVAYLDSPKIIIAVYQRVGYDYLAASKVIRSSPVGGLYGKAVDYSNTSYTGGGGGDDGGGGEEEFPEDDPFPVPEVPEPATIILLSAAALMARYKRKV
ncbi:MAG: PEP-CTERM sorting domain-containing protein [Phycisphaerae bacterium]|nr:PEP-CTERM sorting domain-containing protein [Phycisphaerae bacterium]